MAKRCPVEALLLVGPTGAGKTPLGEALEARGRAGRACAHFDFGSELRRAGAAERALGQLTEVELATVREVLASGRLLEDNEFPIAHKLLAVFLDERIAGRGGPLVILNGLPRHAGQARDIADLVRVAHVVALDCTDGVVLERIARNTGGDRAERSDDQREAVLRRVQTYRERTAPLITYYREGGARIIELAVGAVSTSDDMVAALAREIDL